MGGGNRRTPSPAQKGHFGRLFATAIRLFVRIIYCWITITKGGLKMDGMSAHCNSTHGLTFSLYLNETERVRLKLKETHSGDFV